MAASELDGIERQRDVMIGWNREGEGFFLYFLFNF